MPSVFPFIVWCLVIVRLHAHAVITYFT